MKKRASVSMPGRHEWRSAERLHDLGVFVALFALYVASMPRTVTLEDSGEFIVTSAFLGVAHPPGYPVHTLLGHVFTWLPVGSVAFRVHLLSAVAAAGACVALRHVALRLIKDPLFATAAALAYGISATFWSQAIIAEVYSLNALFVFVLLALALAYRQDPGRSVGMALAFVYALSLCNHLPLILLTSPAFLILLFSRRRELGSQFAGLLVAALVGLTPYVFMFLRSQANPPVGFSGPIQGVDEFVQYVARSHFARVDTNPAADFSDRMAFVGFAASEMVRQFTGVGAVVAVCGFVLQWKSWPVAVAGALSLAWIGNSIALALLLGFDYEWQSRVVFAAYPTAAYGVMALWLALGLKEASNWSTARWRLGVRTLAAALVVALAIAATWARGSAVWRAEDTWARDYAAFLLESLEPNAVLFTFGHFHLGPLAYAHLVEGVRPDITLYNERGLVFRNRFFHPHSTAHRAHEAIRSFVRDSRRPVYFMKHSEVDLPFASDDYGLFKRAYPGRPLGAPRFVPDTRLMDFLEGVEANQSEDAWTRFHRQQLRGKGAEWLVGLRATTDWESKRRKELLASMASDYIPSMVVLAADTRAGLEAEEALRRSDQIEALLGPEVANASRAQLHLFRAKSLLDLGRADAAIASLERSVAIHPHPENPAVPHLARLYAWAGRDREHHALGERFAAPDLR